MKSTLYLMDLRWTSSYNTHVFWFMFWILQIMTICYCHLSTSLMGRCLLSLSLFGYWISWSFRLVLKHIGLDNWEKKNLRELLFIPPFCLHTHWAMENKRIHGGRKCHCQQRRRRGRVGSGAKFPEKGILKKKKF